MLLSFILGDSFISGCSLQLFYVYLHHGRPSSGFRYFEVRERDHRPRAQAAPWNILQVLPSEKSQGRVQDNGLKSPYEGTGKYRGKPQFRLVRTWIRKLIAMSLLPEDMVFLVWNDFTKIPPVTGDPHVDQLLKDFATYFENTWLSSQQKVCFYSFFSDPDLTLFYFGTFFS